MAKKDQDEKPRKKRKRGLVDVALVIALAPVVAAAVRVWMYSGGDTSVFLVLLRTLDIPAALIASAMLLVPTALLLLVIILLTDWRARDAMQATLERNPWLAPVFPILFFVMVYTGNILFALGAAFVALLVVVYFSIKRFWPWGHEHINRVVIAPRGDRNRPASMLTIAGVLTVFLIAPSNMWLPLERVERVDSEPLVGYVLESNEEWTTLLTPAKRIEVVQTPKVGAREVCRPGGPVSLATLLYPSDLKNAPDCDEPGS